MKLSQVQIPATLVVATLMLAAICGASDAEGSRATIRGLLGINVGVEPLPDNVKQVGLAEKDIQTDVELKLRIAGIKVLTEKESTDTPGRPFLYVLVTVLGGDGVYAFSYHVSLQQEVLLARDKAMPTVLAPTWSVSGVGKAGRKDLPQYVRDAVKDEIDVFLNAYLSVNPKK